MELQTLFTDWQAFFSNYKILSQDLPESEIPELFRKNVFMDARFDISFKWLFADVAILQDFLNTILRLEGEAKIKALRLRQTDLSLIQASDDLVRIDIHAQNGRDEWFDIEMQRFSHTGIKDRAILYGAVVAAEAHREALLAYRKNFAKISTAARYHVPKVISLWLMNETIDASYGYREEWAMYCKSKVGKPGVLPESNVLSYIWIDLPKFEKEHGLSAEEREWLDLLCNSKDKDDVPKTQNEAILAAYDRLRVRRTPKEILAKMEDRMVTQFDIDCCIDDAFSKGREEERKLQEEQHQMERVNLSKKNLQKGKTPEDVSDFLDIPLSQVLEIQQELQNA